MIPLSFITDLNFWTLFQKEVFTENFISKTWKDKLEWFISLVDQKLEIAGTYVNKKLEERNDDTIKWVWVSYEWFFSFLGTVNYKTNKLIQNTNIQQRGGRRKIKWNKKKIEQKTVTLPLLKT